jgi:cytochrome b involved in lipid metabolism
MDLDTNPVDDVTLINDIRPMGEFKGITFSNYKKTEVKNSLLDNMLKTKIEPACHWCAELLCAGHFMDVWEIILYYVGKHIHLGNPRLTVYLENRYSIFRNIMAQGNFTSEIQLRNNKNIRKLFAEIICVLTYSPRKHSFEPIRINRTEEFDMTQMTERLKAPSVKYAQPVFEKEDPKELYIAINEFSYSISREGSNLMRACYWIEWLIEFENICKKRKEVCRAQRRSSINVEHKFQKDIIWMIWDALKHYAQEERHGDFVLKTMDSLLNLFCIKYTTACCKRRRYMLYFAVGLLTDAVPSTVEIISKDHKLVLVSVLEQISIIYKQIKKNEISPNTDYLFSNLEKHNAMENTMKRLEMLDSLGSFPKRIEQREDDDDDVYK